MYYFCLINKLSITANKDGPCLLILSMLINKNDMIDYMCYYFNFFKKSKK